MPLAPIARPQQTPVKHCLITVVNPTVIQTTAADVASVTHTANTANATARTSANLSLGHPRFDGAQRAAAAAANQLQHWQALFARHGVQAPAHVQGDFAVGLNLPDERDPHRVFLAVDRFAMRSLCYRQVGNHLLFAEKASDLADSQTDIDPQAIFDYLYFHVIPSPRTIFKGIYRLLPGHSALFENGQLSLSSYWQPQFIEPTASSVNFNQLRDEFRQILADSVANQLQEGAIASYLSGGLDSSTVTGFLGQVSGAPPVCYSIGFDAAGYDEMDYARIAARRYQADHREYYVTPDDLVANIARVAGHYDQPFGNSSALPAYCCAQKAQSEGITKLLAGDGGDELYGGNVRYAKQKIFDLYRHVPGPLRSTLLEPLLLNTPLGRLPLLKKGRSYIEQANTAMPERMLSYNLLERLGLNKVLNASFSADIDSQEPLQQQRAVWKTAPPGHLINQMLAYDWRYTLSEADLPKVRGTTDLAGVAVGFPMLDERLVDFSLRLPVDYKLKGMTLRWFFKEALRGFLPDEIISKPKHGFGLPFGLWALQNKNLHQLTASSLDNLAQRNLIRPEFIQQLIKEHLPSHPGYYGEMVWILMMLEQWLQQHRADYKLA